jgi:hypothetical protein
MYDIRMRGKIKLTALAFLLTLGASLVALWAPLSTEVTSGAGQSGFQETVRHVGLVDTEGWGVAAPLSIPVVIALLALVADAVAIRRGRRRRPVLVAATALLVVWTLIELVSVGALYLPAAVVMGISAARRETRRAAAAGRMTP